LQAGVPGLVKFATAVPKSVLRSAGPEARNLLLLRDLPATAAVESWTSYTTLRVFPTAFRGTASPSSLFASPGTRFRPPTTTSTRPSSPRSSPAIDPYGDTEYNEQQAEAALREVQQLDALCATDGERAAVAALREMLAECAGTPGSYLMFVGD
jgi:hypothetical protein